MGSEPRPAQIAGCFVGHVRLVHNHRAAMGEIILKLPRKSGAAVVLVFSLFAGGATSRAQQSALREDASPAVSSDQSAGSVTGVVFDSSGAAIAGASVILTSNPQALFRELKTLTGPDGRFTVLGVEPGPFHLVVRARDFAVGMAEGTVAVGETAGVPAISLAPAPATRDATVRFTSQEQAAEQVKVQEKQRLFGSIPNFYISYDPDPVPMTSKQKYSFAWKQTIAPVSFVMAGAIAGVEQATNRYKGYGQGAEGYAKRYGAVYADNFSGTMLVSAVFPSLLKQDPRYFYKGTGTVRSRTFYAIANSVICKGDNRRWQVNYSSILGNLAAGGISNLYYPAADRHGAGLTFENAAIGIGAQAAVNLLQEFLFSKLTLNSRKSGMLNRKP